VVEALEEFVEASGNIVLQGREALYFESWEASATGVGFT
jgi:hypothetical protein